MGRVAGKTILIALLLAGVVPASFGTELLVRPHDGRAAQSVPIVEEEGASYLPLTSLTRALAVRFSWDPYLFRGWIETDTTATLFTLASPVLSHGGEEAQLEGGVAYGEAGVLLPIGYLELIAERWNGGRTVRWNRLERTFDWGPPADRVGTMRLSQIGHRTTLQIGSSRSPAAAVFWSDLGGIDLLLDHVVVVPESLTVGKRRGLFTIRSVSERPDGLRIGLDVAPRTLGALAQFDEQNRDWRLAATTSREEVERGRFEPLDRVAFPRQAPSGPIVLACWIDPIVEPVEGASLLRGLADRVAEVLSTRIGQEAIVIEGRNAVRMAAKANRYDASAVIGFRMERADPNEDRFQIWTPAPRIRWQRLEGAVPDSVLGPRPPYWCETPALSTAESRKLSETIAGHLTSALGKESLLLGERPSRWAEGLTMPSIVIYPANASRPRSLRRVEDADHLERVARAIAFGVAEAIGTTVSGSGER